MNPARRHQGEVGAAVPQEDGLYDPTVAERVVGELIAIEALSPDAPGSLRAVVRWSDGTAWEALRWWHDEVLFCEGDLLGRSESELRRLHFRRDRDHLRRELE